VTTGAAGTGRSGTGKRVLSRRAGYSWAGGRAAGFPLCGSHVEKSNGFCGDHQLALGIGATTAIFSAVNLVFFETLPYPHASRLMVISDFAGGDDSLGYVAFHTYREVAERSRSFDAIAVVKPWQPTLAGPAEPERLDGQFVTASFFHVMGVPPILGRDFEASDDRFEGPNTVILSEALWKRRFGGNATIIGRQVTLDDNSYTVIGVMPSAFENVLAPSAQLWTTLQYDTSNASNFLNTRVG